MSVLWTYDGFVDVSFVAGEVTEPARNLPRAIILGTVAIVLLYVATNVAYHWRAYIHNSGHLTRRFCSRQCLGLHS